MPKQLYLAFTAEGSTDEAFLSTIITRTLNGISRRNNSIFMLEGVIWLGSAKGDATLAKICTAYHEKGAQILIIHRDTDQNTPQFILDNHISPVLAQLPESIRKNFPIVPLIIRHEQETW